MKEKKWSLCKIIYRHERDLSIVEYSKDQFIGN